MLGLGSASPSTHFSLRTSTTGLEGGLEIAFDMNVQDDHGAAYEAEHVHGVYDAIAHHFSSTRYKVGQHNHNEFLH